MRNWVNRGMSRVFGGDGMGSSIPSAIWILGFVSMFIDIPSELIHSLLPRALS
jgi:hypothetical protein